MANLQDALQNLDALFSEVAALTEFPTWDLHHYYHYLGLAPQEEWLTAPFGAAPVLTAPPSSVSSETVSDKSPRSEDTSSEVTLWSRS